MCTGAAVSAAVATHAVDHSPASWAAAAAADPLEFHALARAVAAPWDAPPLRGGHQPGRSCQQL
jgi:hypothetical protein